MKRSVTKKLALAFTIVIGVLHPALAETVTVNSTTDVADGDTSSIEVTGIAPTDTRESALLTSLPPGGFPAVVRGANGATGVALVEVDRLAP